MALLKITGLTKHYGDAPIMVRALDGVDLEVESQEFVAIVGQSGSGKSTLLHMLGGLDKPTGGSVIINGQDLADMPDEKLTVFRRQNVGFVFQSFNLIAVLSVYENIALPIELDGAAVDTNHIDLIINTLGLGEKRNAMPNQLSGGQQQRVAIARALASKPAIILADEPTGNLDSKTSTEVLNILKQSATKFDQTIIMITHNEDIAKLADRMIHIEDGKIVGAR